MTTTANQQFEADSAKYNKLYAVQAMARDLMRQNSRLLQSEAVAEATKLYKKGERSIW